MSKTTEREREKEREEEREKEREKERDLDGCGVLVSCYRADIPTHFVSAGVFLLLLGFLSLSFPRSRLKHQ